MASQDKVTAVAEIADKFRNSSATVLTEYRGLSVQQLSDLRKQLKGAAAEYKVVKNRLARIAVKGSALDALGAHLKGPTGLAYSKQDPVAVAKVLHAFAKANPQLQIKLGLVEGTVLQPAELKALADLPSREQIRSQIVGAVQGPMAQLVSLLQAPLREIVHVLEARGKDAAEPA